MWPVVKFEEVRRHAEKSLAIYKDLEDQQGIAYSLGAIGWSYYFSDPQKYLNMVEQSVEIFRSIDDKLDLAVMLFWINQFMDQTGQQGYDQLKANYAESLAHFRKLGHLVGILNVLENAARLAIFHEDFQPARAMLEECLEIHQSLGEQGRSLTLELLGHLSFSMGDYNSAQKYLEDSFVLSKINGERILYNWVSVRLGYVLLRKGELEKARELMITTIPRFLDADILVGVVYILEGLASLHLSLKQAETAARLLGWADKTRQDDHILRPPVEEKDVQKDKSAIIEMIGEEAYSLAYDEGRNLSMQQAVELARE